MNEQAYRGPKRRTYERYDLALPVELEFSAPGAEPLTVRGTSINISRGGVLLEIPEPVPTGATCRMTFTDVDYQLEPARCHGRVVHTAVWSVDKYCAAVQFDEVLEFVEPREDADASGSDE